MLITHFENSYLDYKQTRLYLNLSNKDWSRHRRILPWLVVNGVECCNIANLRDIKQKIDPYYYIGEAQMILETNLYYYLFHKRVAELNIPSFKHPFHTRILYRTSDIPIIRAGKL